MTAAAPVAVVTGAGRGLGAAVARTLADSGWRLVLVDRAEDDPVLPYSLSSRADLDRVAETCGGLAVVGDVRRQADLDGAVAQALEHYGRLDAAVAAAAVIAGGRPTWETDEETWQLLMDTDAGGVWRLARAAVPALLAAVEPRRGRFVAVSSAAGVMGLPLLGAYSAAKHAVIGLVRSMAAELGPHGVTANVVAPGSMATTMLDASAAIYGLADREAFIQHQPLGRLIQPAEVAALIAWLLSPAASAVTGAVLAADGAMSAVK